MVTAEPTTSAIGWADYSLFEPDVRPTERGIRIQVVGRWAPEVVVLFIAAVLLPISIAVHYHSLGAANADDWAYDLSAFRLAAHGTFTLFHWGPSNIVGQLLLAVPAMWIFGEHIWVLNAWTCLMGFGGLLALNYLARTLGLSRRNAVFACLILGLGPMWAALSTSFMLDIPALACILMALAVAASDREASRLLSARSVISLLIAVVAFTIRDETIVVIGAIAWCRLWRLGRPTLRQAIPWLTAVSIVAVVCVAFQAWRAGIPNGGHGSGTITPAVQWDEDMWLLPLVGVMLIPAAAIVGPLRVIRRALWLRRRWTLFAWFLMPGLPLVAFLGRTGLVVAWTGGGISAVGKHLVIHPMNVLFEVWGVTSGPPAWVMISFELIALMSVTVLVAAAVVGADVWWTRFKSPDRPTPAQSGYTAGLLVVSLIGSWAVFAVGIKWDLQAWDRYALPLVAFVPALSMYVRQITPPPPEHSSSPLPTILALALVAVIGTFGCIAVDGFVGAEWSYSNEFARTVAPISPQLIYTYWPWTAMQNRYMDYNDAVYTIRPGYAPCFIQEQVRSSSPPAEYVRAAGSWIEKFRFGMVVASGSDRAACRMASS